MLFKLLLICFVGVAVCQVTEKDILPISTTPDVPTTTPVITTMPPETSTTAATTTPTPSTTTTTVAPPTTPVPPPTVGTWNVTDPQTNVTCVMAKMAIQLNVTYPMEASKSGIAVLDIPTAGTTVEGTCGNETQTIVISWTPADLTAQQKDTLLLEFTLNATSKTYALTAVNITLYPDSASFPGASSLDAIKLAANATGLPSAPLAMSYRCKPVQLLNLTGNSFMKVSDLQLEAFHTAGDSKFGAPSDCPAADTTADIVPIAVGCALAGLVVIVLIAYLIGRRRSHAKGYLSM